MVIVKFIGGLKSLTGVNMVELPDLGVSDVTAVIKALVEKYGSKLEDIIMDRETRDPRGRVLILKNGREIGVLEGLQTRVEDKDTIVIIPVVHGG